MIILACNNNFINSRAMSTLAYILVKYAALEQRQYKNGEKSIRSLSSVMASFCTFILGS